MNFIRFIVFSIFLVVANFSAAETISMNVQLTPPQDINKLTSVRKDIDIIDSKIVELIGLRLQYVKRAWELKNGKLPLHDQVREDEIMLRVSEDAVHNGFSASIAKAIFKTLLEQSNIFLASQKKQ